MAMRLHGSTAERPAVTIAPEEAKLRPTIYWRLSLQGFENEPSARLALLAPWLRVASGGTAVWALVATALGSATAFAAFSPLAAVCAITRVHPFDLPYQLVIRRFIGFPPLPKSAAPRRFGCAFSALWAAGTALALTNGHLWLGRGLGLVMVVSAGVTATTHFCAPSWVWRQWERFRLLHLSRS